VILQRAPRYPGMKANKPACIFHSYAALEAHGLTSNSMRCVPLQGHGMGSIFQGASRGNQVDMEVAGEGRGIEGVEIFNGISLGSFLTCQYDQCELISRNSQNSRIEVIHSIILEERMVRSRKYWSGLPSASAT